MKSSNVLSASAGFIILFAAIVTANNITWGEIKGYDRLLAIDYVVKPKSWFGKQTADVFYPPRGHKSKKTLSAIRVFDWGGRKNFGYAELAKGGLGQRNATVHLTSQILKPLNFTIHFYGH